MAIIVVFIVMLHLGSIKLLIGTVVEPLTHDSKLEGLSNPVNVDIETKKEQLC